MKKFFEKNLVWITAISAIATVLFLLIGYYRNERLFKSDFDHEYLGAMGDFLGGFLGSIFGIITIYLVYKTYISQKEELELSRKLIQKQNFESTFFNLIQSFTNSRDTLEKENIKGIVFFESLKQEITDEIKKIEHLAENNEFELLWKQVALDFREKFYDDNLTPESYQNWDLNNKSKFQVLLATFSIYNKNKHLLIHYFSSIEVILDFIDNNLNIEDQNNRKNYVEILNSQISQIELFHIYHFSLLSDRFKNKIIRFKLLERLSYIELIDASVHTNFYSTEIPLEGKLALLD